MKAGLWLEPEIAGKLCEEMLSYYPEEAWFYRDGVPVVVGGRRFLDYRCPQVVQYMNRVVDTLAGEYGADYLKFDYNQDCGAGTDRDGEKPGRGLELAMEAFFDWVAGLRKRYPQLLIEGCASGGQRLDYRSCAEWALVSSSDQTDYKNIRGLRQIFSRRSFRNRRGCGAIPSTAGSRDFSPRKAGCAGMYPTRRWR